ncbi:MAG: hypothetical protein EXR02_08155 [Rhodospirillales bacterium]|nr:hypothetical protein [Rhodospirillales bacterium]
MAEGEAIEALERPKAKERQAAAGPSSGKGSKSSGSGKLPEAIKGEPRAKVAAAIGKKPRSYDKALKIVEAAKAEPKKYGKLVCSRSPSVQVTKLVTKLEMIARERAR